LLGARETPALRRAFVVVLDRVGALNQAARPLPNVVRSRRLRAETMFIRELAVRLKYRLDTADPLAGRVALTKTDALFSLFRAVGALVCR
jgi:hypothetical protein